MPDETDGEKRNVIVFKNQNYERTRRMSVSAQYAAAVKNIHGKAEGSRQLAVSFSSLS